MPNTHWIVHVSDTLDEKGGAYLARSSSDADALATLVGDLDPSLHWAETEVVLGDANPHWHSRDELLEVVSEELLRRREVIADLEDEVRRLGGKSDP